MSIILIAYINNTQANTQTSCQRAIRCYHRGPHDADITTNHPFPSPSSKFQAQPPLAPPSPSTQINISPWCHHPRSAFEHPSISYFSLGLNLCASHSSFSIHTVTLRPPWPHTQRPILPLDAQTPPLFLCLSATDRVCSFDKIVHMQSTDLSGPTVTLMLIGKTAIAMSQPAQNFQPWHTTHSFSLHSLAQIIQLCQYPAAWQYPNASPLYSFTPHCFRPSSIHH